MYRKECCVCDGQLKKIKTLNDYPLSYYPKNTPEDDRTEDCDIGVCESCDTIQFMNLIDPVLLYGDFHNNTSFSKKWQDHHDSFYKFIKDKLHGKCIEIGGKSREIVKRLDDNIRDKYYTLDFSNTNDDPKNLTGNCEEFDFVGFDCIIMSHVFEHLYNPKKFAKNIEDIDDIFISIPNMKYVGMYLPIHREHPYLCTESTIMRLFPKYSCTIEYFENHSIFIHLFKTNCISQNVLKFYNKLENTKIENDYVFPSGMQGSNILYFTKCNNIKGFVDNDPMKQGKYIMGKKILPIEENMDIFTGHSLYNNDKCI